MSLHSINAARGFYVLEHGKGFTCLGFEYALKTAQSVAEWLNGEGESCKMPDAAAAGTEAGYVDYERVMAAGAAYNARTGKRCEAELIPILRGLEGRRVEVVDKYGERRRFIVGRSTGWMPCHLEIARRNSSGGGAMTGAPFQSVRVV